MPRENRKRGKKHKKTAEDTNEDPHIHEDHVTQVSNGPSWIVPAATSSEFNPEAPFGYVDSEVKAYFRTVDVQIRDWQEGGSQETEGDDADPNEDRRLFFMAALTEMSGKEKELATDPDCSNILERMSYSMDDFARRVFMDRLTGSYKTLIKHRFASHVCQTFIEVAADTVARECNGVLPPSPEHPEEGELPLMRQLILDVCEELTHDLPSLIMDPFASHVLRGLLAVLCPTILPPEHKSTIRSKKSSSYKARQGPKTSVFDARKPGSEASPAKAVPGEFKAKARSFVQSLSDALGANEVRALAASQVASPLLQMLLEIEADQGLTSKSNSLSDRVLDGLITRMNESQDADHQASDYVGTLLRDPTSSHLLETIVRRLPVDVFSVVWELYFKETLPRLAVHPVANFVVAKALDRSSKEQLGQACENMSAVSEKIYKSSRTGVFRAMIERAGHLQVHETAVIDMILNAAGISKDKAEELNCFVPCVLRLISLGEYQMLPRDQMAKSTEKQTASRRRPHAETSEDNNVIKTQGAVLLQSMLKLPSPHYQVVLDSIYGQPMAELIAMAHDVTASRVLDVILQSSTVSFKEKRQLVMKFIGHYHLLVDDRIGSRVGDNCWAFADPYLRGKIARSLIAHERTLTGSFYGKFFARNLNLYLLQRNPEQWKTIQTSSKLSSTSQGSSFIKHPHGQMHDAHAVAANVESIEVVRDNKGKERKRKARSEDEIDQLFENKLGKKIKKAELAPVTRTGIFVSGEDEDKSKKNRRTDTDGDGKDIDLEKIFGAIKAAPKDDGSRNRKSKKAG